ncbi:N-acetylmuramoyl-L-alanine amidase [Bacillus sp. AK031]
MKFIIDAGHGYSTPGKRSPAGMREYEFNREAALAVKENLLKYENTSVVFTHSDQRDVPLKARTDLANEKKGDAFISIHANAFGSSWNEASGIETYVYKTRPEKSVRLAEIIQKRLISKTGLVNRGVKAADFHVLRETEMTAVLVECGFMTNKGNAELLKKESFRRLCGKEIALALADVYQLIKKDKPGGLFRVQAGAFANRDNAEILALRLKRAGFEAFISRE